MTPPIVILLALVVLNWRVVVPKSRLRLIVCRTELLFWMLPPSAMLLPLITNEPDPEANVMPLNAVPFAKRSLVLVNCKAPPNVRAVGETGVVSDPQFKRSDQLPLAPPPSQVLSAWTEWVENPATARPRLAARNLMK